MISSRIVSRVLQRLEGEVCVELIERTTEVGLLDRLADGELDVVFTEGPLGPGPFASETLFVDPYVLVAPASRRSRSDGAPLSLRELARLPLVGHSDERPARSSGTSPREASAPTTSFAPTSTRRSRRSSGTASRTPSCRASRSTRRDDDVAVIPLDPVDAIEPRVVLVAWNSDRTLERPIAAFVDATRAVCAELDLVAA